MATEWNYASGDWWIICDVCGKKIRATTSKQRWDGLIVCPEDWETRHSLDFIRTYTDKISVPFSRPEPTDQFVDVTFRMSAVAGIAIAGFAVAGTP